MRWGALAGLAAAVVLASLVVWAQTQLSTTIGVVCSAGFTASKFQPPILAWLTSGGFSWSKGVSVECCKMQGYADALLNITGEIVPVSGDVPPACVCPPPSLTKGGVPPGSTGETYSPPSSTVVNSTTPTQSETVSTVTPPPTNVTPPTPPPTNATPPPTNVTGPSYPQPAAPKRKPVAVLVDYAVLVAAALLLMMMLLVAVAVVSRRRGGEDVVFEVR